ncbi:MAG: hypothetical protein KGJ64_14305, partial [Betaproteobacteria bacterium]|nr:hypothetical protein [Betaproteobacteria bacterium]
MEAVASTLNYLVAQREPVHTYAYDPPDGSPRFNASLRPYPVRLADARQLAADPGSAGWVRGRGFTLLRQRWPTAALDDPDGPRRLYAQAEELLCALSGAAHA